MHYTGCFIIFSVITNIYNKKTKEPTLMELFTATGKLKKFFLTTRDVRSVHHRWHCTQWYNIQVLATHALTWVHWYSSLLQWSVSLHSSSEEYWCTHVDACVARTLISYRSVPCHPWCTHRTSLVVKKNFFCFPMAVNNSIKVGPLVFLLQIFIIMENIMKLTVYKDTVVPFIKHMLLLESPMCECCAGKSWLFIVRMNKM
jgi:hypothetical protein